MNKKPIERLYGIPIVVIMLILLIKYLGIFPLPNWALGLLIALGAITFFCRGHEAAEKEVLIQSKEILC